MLPYPDTIDIPFRGKTLRTRLTHKAVLQAERDLSLNILYAQEPMLIKQPVGFQMAAWLYVLASAKLPNLTFDECLEASMGDHREQYITLFSKVIEQMVPLLLEVNGLTEAAVAPPLDESAGGESAGLPLESTSV